MLMECGISIIHADTEIVVPLHTDENAKQVMYTPNTTVLLLKHINYNEKNHLCGDQHVSPRELVF
ncbi:hypothetical protein [Paenibacillus beijingensis]|uniref:hypothetical protein n=1 Tax=Paenibacillus beijingensis TaxID=1126833 RepID=UPI003B75C302